MHIRHSSRPLRTLGAALTAAALLSSGCSADASAPRAAALSKKAVPAALKPYYEQTLSWRPCGGADFECATLKAPLDYARPGTGRDLRLAVSRKKATGTGRRLGSLLVNPGGPGGSAVGYLQSFAAVGYPARVRARYDMVAMDPRGVAESEPITCLSDKQMDTFTQTDQTPDGRGETDRLVAAYKKFAHGCATRSGRILGHVSTVEAARDMDLLRAALGDRKLTYVGASYGTFLGATYADLYPHRVGRLVLDGALDPTLSSRRINRDQTAGFETAFTAFAKDCVRRTGCPLGTGSVATARDRLGAFFARLDSHPARTGDSRALGEPLATIGVISAMYDETAWPQLRTALRSAMGGHGGGLLNLADLYYERDTDGSYANLMYANPAVNCLDLPPAFRTPAEVKKSIPDFQKASPVFGKALAWAALNCAYWPVRPTGTAHALHARGAAPIVVVGTTRDPATPYPWARALATQLSSATLLTYDGDGHTAYGRGSGCIDNAINTYLLTGRPPTPHTRCH
ncbi:alpha/beta hydrolase [Streptomyces rapamycinicus]|uniref:Proteinase n=2 Tax=Streptomyces rapamycinicus TaxID=1226757 RepID=A0A0A0NHV8_STRRN|nr:alpha/beta hydrolase [Streptomyces rapamycinicus]AGP56796.1 proteinase [Streptomyces rapamycinicus NRRL 5491]MBB4784408.1 pimeloyl-ACP methyl ester carboxylesterase [Streptomyces rapamycinicus]RLV80108.1 proteinase [Streptomyces rapamycinicus NRRL 5491]UTO64721.1 alpha/beta hydrolase [Streptomyces rapamycinicus]UTP32678.1 alpha/beta hydrolase [Streptomyces rapamycinicus NRRL 5491]